MNSLNKLNMNLLNKNKKLSHMAILMKKSDIVKMIEKFEKFA